MWLSLEGASFLLGRAALLALLGAGMGCGNGPLRPRADGGVDARQGGQDGAAALDTSPDGQGGRDDAASLDTSPDGQGDRDGATPLDTASDGVQDLAQERSVDVGPVLDGGADLGATPDDGGNPTVDGAGDGARDVPASDSGCGALTGLTNCGACGNDCTRLPNVRPGAPVECVAGRCSFRSTSCVRGFDNCNQSVMDGCEADLTSVRNCGACSVSCPEPNPTCAVGINGLTRCKITCVAPLPTLCGDSCADLSNDVAHCGSCFNNCDFLQSRVHPVPCRAGKCHPVCVEGWANCDADPDCETPLDSIRACGACGVAAPCALANVVSTCVSGGGSCVDPYCAVGYANCDKTSADCEAPFGSAGASCAPRYVGTTVSPVDLDTDLRIAVGNDGATFMAGTFVGMVDMDPGSGVDLRTPSHGLLGGISESDVFVTRLNSDGSYAWTRVLGGAGYEAVSDLVVTADGSVLLLGTSTGNVDLDSGAAMTMGSTTGRTPYIVKLDRTGRFEWQRQLDNQSGSEDVFTGRMLLDPSGAIVATGYFQNATLDFDPGAGTRARVAMDANTTFLLKLTSGGDFTWVGFLEGQSCYVSGLTGTTGGTIWVVGDVLDVCDLDPGEGIDRRATTRADRQGSFMLKLGSDGRSQGVWILGTGEYVSAYTVVAGQDGGVIVGGTFSGSVDFDTGAGTALRTTSTHAGFLLRLAQDGAFQWVEQLTETGVVAAGPMIGGGVVALTMAGLPLPPGSVTTAFVTGFDTNRTPLWTIPIGPPSSFGRALAVGPLGFSVVGSQNDGAVDVNPGPTVETINSQSTFVSRFAF